MQKIFITLLFLLTLSIISVAQVPTESEWLWPYDSASIWNMPIHKNANYYFIGDNFYHHNKYVDDVFMAVVSEDDPDVEIAQNNCGGWSNKCEDCGDHPNLPMAVPFPDMEVGCGTANNTCCFCFPDGNWIVSQAMGRESETSDLRFRDWARFVDHDVRGEGLKVDGHGATGLSALGGTIRLGELTTEEPIQHALKVTGWALEYCYSQSHRWPAKRSDGYSANYRGDRPKLKIGALLALHKDANLDSMGFETEVGRKLAQAMQTYGAYFVEDSYDWGSGYGAWGWVLEAGVKEETESFYGVQMRGAGAGSAYFRDINRIAENTYVIDNNTKDTIGGGPNDEIDYPEHRLAPLLPPVGTEDRNLVNTAVKSQEVIVPQSAVLYQNYPNPFNPTTVIPFQLPQTGHVSLKIFNIQGQIVANLIDQVLEFGYYNIAWDVQYLTSGQYFIMLKTDQDVQNKKCLVLK